MTDDDDIHFHMWGARHDSDVWMCMTPWCNATIDMSPPKPKKILPNNEKYLDGKPDEYL